MSDDIVARLERLMCSEAGCGDMRIYMTAKLAAAEIQLLREENRELSGDAGQLREERDEARREVCVRSCRVVRADRWMPTERVAFDNEEDVAKSRGWDCFEDENK